MTIKEQLQFFANHGMSITYIAKQINVSPPTLTKWLRGEKGITHKNEKLVHDTLKTIANNFLEVTQ